MTRYRIVMEVDTIDPMTEEEVNRSVAADWPWEQIKDLTITKLNDK